MTRSLTVGLSILFAAAASAQTVERSPWTVRDHLPIGEFVIQAHRGAGDLAEENTVEAFKLGWSLNCIPEADVRATRDGVIVAFHDDNFARVVLGASPELAKKGVADLTFAELQKLDVGAWKGDEFKGRRVGALREVFDLMARDRSRRLYMDVKQVDPDQLAREIREADVASQTILASTKYPMIREWKALVPESKTLLWMGGTEEALAKRFEELRRADFEGVDQLQIHTNLTMPADRIDRDAKDPFKESDAFLIARGEELRKRGIVYQTLPWNGAAPGVYAKLLDLGFMSFATDHPKITWRAVRSYYEAE